MNKKWISIGIVLLSVLLTACGTESSWEEVELVEVSDRMISDDIKVNWELEQNQASNPNTLVRLKASYQGEPIEDFEITHEKLLHLIVVSKDLSYFNHIHPEYKGDGVFEVKNEFPAGGEYRVIADFKPTNGDSLSKLD